MEYLKLGQIVTVFGIKGELKVYPYTDSIERFEELKEILIEETLYKVEKVRYQNGNIVILKLDGVNDRNLAETFRGKYILIEKNKAKKLAEGSYYIFDLVGIAVYDESENNIGKLINVIQNEHQDLYEIEMENGKTFLIPAVEEFIIKIDIENKRMIVKLIEGLME